LTNQFNAISKTSDEFAIHNLICESSRCGVLIFHVASLKTTIFLLMAAKIFAKLRHFLLTLQSTDCEAEFFAFINANFGRKTRFRKC